MDKYRGKEEGALDIIKRNTRAVMTARERLRQLRDYKAYGLTESYRVQMEGRSRWHHHGVEPSRGDRVPHLTLRSIGATIFNSLWLQRNSGTLSGRVTQVSTGINWFVLERESFTVPLPNKLVDLLLQIIPKTLRQVWAQGWRGEGGPAHQHCR